uniref:Uncharacterized protein n=1 Tax=Elaeophora elaphi TaxID=1147741 RepID=A0A0R3S4X8_9BILA
MTTTYSIHPPGATASRGLLSHHHHHHSHSPHQQYRRHQASSLDSIRTTAAIISPSSLQRIVNGTDGIVAAATTPSAIGVIPPPPPPPPLPPPFDTVAAPNPAITALNGTICRPSSSDCGASSSGLGGMTKTDIISSDESSLARFFFPSISSSLIQNFLHSFINAVYFNILLVLENDLKQMLRIRTGYKKNMNNKKNTHDVSSSFVSISGGNINKIENDAPVGVRSAWVIPHPVLLNNGVPPMFMSCNTVPTSSTSPTPMFFDHECETAAPYLKTSISIFSNVCFLLFSCALHLSLRFNASYLIWCLTCRQLACINCSRSQSKNDILSSTFNKRRYRLITEKEPWLVRHGFKKNHGQLLFSQVTIVVRSFAWSLTTENIERNRHFSDRKKVANPGFVTSFPIYNTILLIGKKRLNVIPAGEPTVRYTEVQLLPFCSSVLKPSKMDIQNVFHISVRGNINVTQRAPTSIGSNDLFVHIQTGETLSIVIGNDVQHISGPATVRMVNQAGMSPSALPLHVPPGHMVQQMVDEQITTKNLIVCGGTVHDLHCYGFVGRVGVLRHLILSPEAAPGSHLIPKLQEDKKQGAYFVHLSSLPRFLYLEQSTFLTAPPPAAVSANTPLHNSSMTTPLKSFAQNSPSPPIVPPYPPPAVPYSLHNSTDFSEGKYAFL